MIAFLADVLSAGDLARVVELARCGRYEDGAASAGYRARRAKTNLELAPAEATREIGVIVLNALDANAEFARVAQPARAAAPIISRYTTGMRYGSHMDEPVDLGPPLLRRDVSVTLFLGDPSSYDGGELVVEDGAAESRIKLPLNHAVAYPASRIHRVEPVTRGERLAAVTWIQSLVRDEALREMCAEMLSVARRLHALDPEGRETLVAYKCWSNLLRRAAGE